MFLLYVLGVFAISLFGSQCQPQTRETLFACRAWGDPHIQTWHAKNGDKIQNRDCYVNGKHDLVKNNVLHAEVHVHNKWADKADVKVYDVKTEKLLLHYKSEIPHNPTADENLRQQGVTVTQTTNGAQTTTVISYAQGQVSVTIQGQPTRVDNIIIHMQPALAEQSTGMCALRDAACTMRGLPTDELEWQPVGSGSTRQFITNEQAEIICNEHIDAFFAKIHPAPYERDAHVNSMVADILHGCIVDVVSTGEIEAARAGINVLMMDELTKDATSIEAIQAAVESGIEEASLLLNDAANMANVRVRRMI